MISHQKKSFFERLMGSDNDAARDPFEDDTEQKEKKTAAGPARLGQDGPTSDEEGELLVDVYHTPDEIVIQAILGGVARDEIDISATQEMITIRATREHPEEVGRENYYNQELYWGTFSRSIMLPQEIDIDATQANFSNGLLTIRLSKIDKERIEKIKVKME